MDDQTIIKLSDDQYINRNLNDDNFHDDHANYTKCHKVFYKAESVLFRIFYGDEKQYQDSNDSN